MIRLPVLVVVLSLPWAGCLNLAASSEPLPPPDYVVPVMGSQPKLDGRIAEGEWAEALRIESSFVIADGSAGSGSYPFSLWLGIDETALHLAVEIRNIGPNPYTMADGTMFPDTLNVYFTGPRGSLAAPSDFVALDHIQDFGASFTDGSWTGTEWTLQQEMHTERINEGYPIGGRYGMAKGTNETIVYEFYLERTSPLTDVDGLQLVGSSDFRLCLMFVRQDAGRSDGGHGGPYEWAWDVHSDTFPGDGPTRGTQNKTGEWLRLRTAI